MKFRIPPGQFHHEPPLVISIPVSLCFQKCVDCAKAREKIIFLKSCLKEDILLPSNHHKRFDIDLLLEDQRRKESTDLKILSNRARCDPSFWHNLSEHDRREVYQLRHLMKLKYI